MVQGSGDVNPALLLPPSSASGEWVGAPTAETVASTIHAASQEAAAAAEQPWSRERKETPSNITGHLLESPEVQQPFHHMQIGQPDEAQGKQAAQQTVESKR